jgi:Protein of unknown function (DUF1592)/Protein of unknown function (DUF1588)/Protein of unknown function (DUF1587)/Protein of unknown function (DUF1585)/Protein of unknown function (DUF1595)/Planctomycete cytochrome C
MSKTIRVRVVSFFVVALCLTGLGVGFAPRLTTGPIPESSREDSGTEEKGGSLAGSDPGASATPLEHRFAMRVRPFLQRYCFSCHGSKKPKASLDLTRDATVAAVANNVRHWGQVLERLQAREMPPEDAPRQPKPDERAEVIAWIRDLRDQEARRNAGDPGTVLARRLSNAEFDCTIRDLTGVDIRPTHEFPVDPANEAGFDNSGESLAMSPALLKKYLAAVRRIADHVVLEPEGFVFAPHPAVTDPDRDKYCVKRIIDFYERHKVDYTDYFLAAWKYRHRDLLGRPDTELSAFAVEAGLSAKYLSLIWLTLTHAEAERGPLAVIRKKWEELPKPDRTLTNTARPGCKRLRDLVVDMRKKLNSKVNRLQSPGQINPGSQVFLSWWNRQMASQRRSYSGNVVSDMQKLAKELKVLTPRLPKGKETDAKTQQQLRGAFERFCAAFPDAFAITGRTINSYPDPDNAEVTRIRPLSAGFHLMQGYFRDDQPLCELVLDERQRRELDTLWHELQFVTQVAKRQYKDFIFFEREEASPEVFIAEAEFDFARSEDKDVTSEDKMDRLARGYLAKARRKGISEEVLKAIEAYFIGISSDVRSLERARLAAEPSHLRALVKFTERAFRRPLSLAERDQVLAFYSTLRQRDKLEHEEAVRDTLASVLLSPHFCYRSNQVEAGAAVRPLSDYALASRLSYFLWSSMPDAELLACAAAGDLHEPEVLKAQTRRMLRDPRVRGLATEFGGNWLDFRHFEDHNSVDRQRFPTFTNELRQAMFEEPVRYLMDVAQRNRSILDLLYGNDTFVNRLLAIHYGMPAPGEKKKGLDSWIHVNDAWRYGRGGLLPMAVFLTKNAPGLRTSPVKRGYWVVRRVLGESIPPPPPTVPELPKDEAKLGELTLPQLLARHRENKSCAACHRRFDSIGLVFESFGPIGEHRTTDLGGHPIQTAATFPDGKEGDALKGLRKYLHEKRQEDYVENLCRKLFSYALGRSLLLSDNKTLDGMRTRLVAERYSFGSLVESIVLSPQFLNKRGHDDPRGQ